MFLYRWSESALPLELDEELLDDRLLPLDDRDDDDDDERLLDLLLELTLTARPFSLCNE